MQFVFPGLAGRCCSCCISEVAATTIAAAAAAAGCASEAVAPQPDLQLLTAVEGAAALSMRGAGCSTRSMQQAVLGLAYLNG
eukprot:1160901-Pelagomonas_calceolata.AAC.11